MTDVKIDSGDVRQKIDRLFEIWDKYYEDETSPWYKADAVVVLMGKNSGTEADDTSRVVYFQLWLTGFLFPETLMVFTRDKIVYILSSAKKIAHFQQIKDAYENLHLLVRNPEEGGTAGIDTVISSIKNQNPSGKSRISRPKTQAQRGSVAESWEKQLDVGETNYYDNIFSVLLSVRTDLEMKYQKLSATCCSGALKNVLINKIEHILDNEERETHSDIANCVEGLLVDEKLLKKWKDKFRIDPTEIEFVYCTVQSGENFELRISADATTKNLSQEEGAIIVGVGAKYAQVPTNVIRTLLLNGTKEQKTAYSFALELLQEVFKSLEVGKAFNEVYENATSYVKKHKPEFCDKFLKNVGHCMTTDFRDSALLLSASNKSVSIEAGMVFNIAIGFSNLKTKTGSVYAVWLADTVVVNPAPAEQEPKYTVLTDNVSKSLEHVAYELEDEAEDEKPAEKESPKNKKDKEKTKEKEKERAAVSASVLSNAESVILGERLRRMNKTGATAAEVEERDRRQRELRIKKLQDIKDRFEAGNAKSTEEKKSSIRRMDSIQCFDSVRRFPSELKPNKLYVHNASESLFVPINGAHVPFHVMTMKNVTCNPEEGQNHHTMRINFQVPGSQTLTAKGDENPLPELTAPNSLFIKELLYRSEDGRHLQGVHRAVKELIKRVKQKETEADVARDLADQEKLIISRTSRRIILKDLLVRPNINMSRKVMGSLEAHPNGFRFQLSSRSGQSDCVDITYANIKHAIFQPCERELIVLIHFHLKSPIMVGKKKSQDVQFYCEAGAQTDDLDNRRKNYHDPDEMQEEIRDREIRRKLNNAFKSFVQQVEELSGLEFDVPYRELMFYGVPLKSSSEILPTANCLVHLVEWPPFVLPLEDIEIVSFERVQHGLRNFDMTFVFQDYSKAVKQVTSIPTEYLDNLKRWLNELDIVWYENKNNLSWPLVMKTIRDDLEGFVDMGGFESVLGDGTVRVPGDDQSSSHADDSDDDEEDEEYDDDNDSEEDENSDDSEDSDEESLADESDDDSVQDMGSDEEEGLSWDELEERAKRDDRKRVYEQEQEDTSTARNKKRMR